MNDSGRATSHATEVAVSKPQSEASHHSCRYRTRSMAAMATSPAAPKPNSPVHSACTGVFIGSVANSNPTSASLLQAPLVRQARRATPLFALLSHSFPPSRSRENSASVAARSVAVSQAAPITRLRKPWPRKYRTRQRRLQAGRSMYSIALKRKSDLPQPRRSHRDDS